MSNYIFRRLSNDQITAEVKSWTTGNTMGTSSLTRNA
jgi:hypothetical protein